MTLSDDYANSRYPYFDQVPKQTYPQPHYAQHPPPVKVEAGDSPNLRTSPQYSQQSPGQFSRKTSVPIYQFGSPGNSSTSSGTTNSSFTFMSSHPWPPLPSTASTSVANSAYQHQSHQYVSERIHSYSMQPPANGHPHTHSHAQMSLTDEYDDGDDDGLSDLPSAGGIGAGLNIYNDGSTSFLGSDTQNGGKGEKQVRRRSSKACDQCRKSKCKCERVSAQEPCRNCVMLGTACTFLGPSRKRGPPKGYIDAIEARLHQTEALIGILLSSRDSRAQTLLDDLREDPLAKDIITRVDNGTYGHKGRMKASDLGSKARPQQGGGKDSDSPILAATHPSGEWQDHVIAHLNSVATERNTTTRGDTETYKSSLPDSRGYGSVHLSGGKELTALEIPSTSSHSRGEFNQSRTQDRSALNMHSSATEPGSGPGPSLLGSYGDPSDDNLRQTLSRRQRRRVDPPERDGGNLHHDLTSQRSHLRSPSTSASGRSRSPVNYVLPSLHPALLNSKKTKLSPRNRDTAESPQPGDEDADVESADEGDDGSAEDELAVAVGQLSINEDEQLRYHGKASGLHLLGASEREDGRSQGGIWRFPQARVWPPLPSASRTVAKTEQDWLAHLPTASEQDRLLGLYWTYVHPALPILHKKVFLENFWDANKRSDRGNSPGSQVSDSASSLIIKSQRIPAILLLAMFSIAARYSASNDELPPPEDGSMWVAGDSYLESAKAILDSTYSYSRPSTCQALLLMGYREVGIGAMAQAWLYIGMAVRMAQDLGMHKCADKWSNVGKALFTPDELQERRRIWYGCVIMDKYVSAYIGRPVTVFENDFDTELPCLDQPDELEVWSPHVIVPTVDNPLEAHPPTFTPVPSHAISCFNEFAKLSIILSMIVQTIYPIRRHAFRSCEHSRLEKLLDKWYFELPEHLYFDPASQKDSSLPPHGLTLHLHYWCTVLLLHRPFIRHLSDSSKSLAKEQEVRPSSRKTYDLCVQAANHITSIVSVYVENHCPRRTSVFLCYYVFTAAIMHVAALTTYPNDPQASLGLHKCMDMLQRMSGIWPSAWRALQLLQGSKVQTHHIRTAGSPSAFTGRKRGADNALEPLAALPAESMYRESHGYARAPSSAQPQTSYPLGLDLPQVEAPAFFQPFDRWAPESNLNNFPGGSLSTSVLPHQYSTGLVDDRLQRGSERSTQRFPQYWSDYTLGQIESAYGVPPTADIVASNSAATPRTSQSGAVYSQEQYLVFNNMPPSGQQ